MHEKRSGRNSLIAAAVIMAAAASIFAAAYVRKNGPAAKPESNEVVEIKEKMFATQVSDVYLNAPDYLGKTIKLEGVFKSERYYEDQAPYCFVVRYGPGGCCGADANVGFEVKWAEDRVQPYPASESWVEAAGELKVDQEGYYLYLDLATLTVLSERGAETVLQ